MLRSLTARALSLILAGALLAVLASVLSSTSNDKTPSPVVLQVGPDLSANGINQFNRLSDALLAVPADSDAETLITLAAGVYREKLIIDKPHIRILGQGQDKTVISFDAYAGQLRPDGSGNWSTWGSATVIVRATDISIEALHIENSYDYLANDALASDDPNKQRGSQAVALMLDRGSDRFMFKNGRLSGYQDTLFTLAGRSLFNHALIEGNVDFIFGAGTALFVDSDIKTLPRAKPVSPIGYITAPSTQITQRYGLVFIDSRLTRHSAVADNVMALGRPWHPTTQFADGRYADPNAIGQAVFINSWMDAHIMPRPWLSMGGTAPSGERMQFSPDDARFFEFNSCGPGAGIASDNRRQLTAEQAALFTPELILGDWQPELLYEPHNLCGS
ncbi:MAG: pectinesterase family protein [Pseudomonadales bacterium]|nr:pectinesterase family protein [Pseudomonadales bacterium]MDP4640776.1 pectinesterase family protein [Pseudomonadales bacterium]MDP4911267.1 pectinesterase family protein [Pseudomonadales bacterium]